MIVVFTYQNMWITELILFMYIGEFLTSHFYYLPSRFYPAIPGDIKDCILRMIQALSRFNFFFIVITFYHNSNTKRLGLNPIPKLVNTKTCL